MGKGIQIRKPEHADTKLVLAPMEADSSLSLPPLFYLMLILTFPAALVALYFFFQTRNV